MATPAGSPLAELSPQSSGPFASVCVYCGSSTGTKPEFVDAAVALGASLATRSIRLVYGGGSVGLMGAVSTSAHARGGSVLGVIPTALEPVEVSGGSVGEVMVVRDMHERKAAMASAADAFVAMPGGFGTLEELLEMITWQQLEKYVAPTSLIESLAKEKKENGEHAGAGGEKRSDSSREEEES